MSKLLLGGHPLLVDPQLATHIGKNAAIVLQQIHYWIEKNRESKKNFKEGRYWTYNSIQNWRDQNFAFWSYSTVKRIFSRLVKKGFLLKANYNKWKTDRTIWYSIDYEALEKFGYSAFNSQKTISQVQKSPKNAIGSKCTNPFGQNAPIHLVKMTQPIPETTEGSLETTHTPIITGSSTNIGRIEHERGGVINSKTVVLVKCDCNDGNVSINGAQNQKQPSRPQRLNTQRVTVENTGAFTINESNDVGVVWCKALCCCGNNAESRPNKAAKKAKRKDYVKNEALSQNTQSKPQEVKKVKYADFVHMTPEQHSILLDKLGADGLAWCIELLNSYKGSTGKTYKCDYYAMLGWPTMRYNEHLAENKKRDEGGNGQFNGGKTQEGSNKSKREIQFGKRRTWDHEELARASQEYLIRKLDEKIPTLPPESRERIERVRNMANGK